LDKIFNLSLSTTSPLLIQVKKDLQNVSELDHNREVSKSKTPLAESHPDWTAQSYGWDPRIFVSTGRKVFWMCENGYLFPAVIKYRAELGSGCRKCAGKKAINEMNDLLTTRRALALEAVGWDPTEVMAGSGVRRTWKCELGHLWEAPPQSRERGQGCP
jgi:hypothetical protein